MLTHASSPYTGEPFFLSQFFDRRKNRCFFEYEFIVPKLSVKNLLLLSGQNGEGFQQLLVLFFTQKIRRLSGVCIQRDDVIRLEACIVK